MDINKFIQEYAEKMKHIQEEILEFIENDDAQEEDYNDITKFLNEINIRDNQHDLKFFLHLISKISDNHKRQNDFFTKIEFIFKIFQADITKYFTNIDVFNIFKSNKRFLLFLFEEKIIIPDESIYTIVNKPKYFNQNYMTYFYPEFKSFITSSNEFEMDQYFEINRKTGNNSSLICELIQKDSIDEFVVYINRNNLSTSALIPESIFETNLFLLKKHPTLIEYSAFFGSIQIFNNLRFSGAELDSSLWIYAIHGGNPDIIHLLEEIEIQQPSYTYNQCYKEAIKCHNIPIMNYMRYDLLTKKRDKDIGLFSQCLPYYNFIDFCSINNDFSYISIAESDLFYYLCKYDYITIVDFILKNRKIDVTSDIKIFKLH